MKFLPKSFVGNKGQILEIKVYFAFNPKFMIKLEGYLFLKYSEYFPII